MPEYKQYLEMMLQSLEKKKELLNQLVILNSEQSSIVQEEEMDMEAFSKNVEKKSEIIERLGRMDEGFDTLYARIREEILTNRARYHQEIAQMQKLIGEITDRSMSIQAAELRNKQRIESHFELLHKNVRETKVSTKAAANYYKSMSNTHMAEPSNIDIRSKNYKKS